jgi:hypothetical protein
VALPAYIWIINGIRFLYTNTLHCQVPIERIPFPRSEKKFADDREPRRSQSPIGRPKNPAIERFRPPVCRQLKIDTNVAQPESAQAMST